jgi:hypothetical protein
MLAFLQSIGTDPVSIEVWKMAANPCASCGAHSRKTLFGIPSGPGALCGMILPKSFSTPLVVKSMLFISSMTGELRGGANFFNHNLCFFRAITYKAPSLF